MLYGGAGASPDRAGLIAPVGGAQWLESTSSVGGGQPRGGSLRGVGSHELLQIWGSSSQKVWRDHQGRGLELVTGSLGPADGGVR